MSAIKLIITFSLAISFCIFSKEKEISIDCENDNFETTKPKYAETEEERVKRLEKELERALAQFDECLEDTNSSEGSSNSRNNSSASSAPISGSKKDSQTKKSIQSSTVSGQQTANNERKESSNKSSSTTTSISGEMKEKDKKGFNSKNGSTPEDIPIESDDDIVARQLRQLAMEEKDPVKKEEYWEKYREYKGIKKGEKK
tara:strand:- start:8299 stop:8901 length:603 start_codon:yes stop_codon:yes gene_type:complete